MENRKFGSISYIFIMTNVGLVTSSFTPRSFVMIFTKAVFPAPRCPDIPTTVAPNELPSCGVCRACRQAGGEELLSPKGRAANDCNHPVASSRVSSNE